MIRNFVLGMAVMLVLCGAVSAQRVAGVWRLDEIKTTGANAETLKFSQPNMYLFTKSHYSIIRIEGDKARSTDDSNKMTAEQLLDTYVKGFTANAGTYEMKGNSLTMKVMIAKSPTYMQAKSWVSFNVKITGQKMTCTSTATQDGPTKDPAIFTFTRVE